MTNEAFSLKSASVRWAGWATVTWQPGRVGKLKTRVGKPKIFFRRFAPNFAHPGLKPCRRPWSVPLSVTFVDHVKTNRGLNVSSKFFQPSGSHAILVFPYQIGRRYSDGNPLTEASNAGGYRHKSRFWCNSWLSKIAGRANCQKHLPRTKLCI